MTLKSFGASTAADVRVVSNRNMSFKGKVVLVTGASSGIGAAIAVAFAKEDADVVLVGRNEERLVAVEQTCAGHGGTPLVIKADVSKDDDARNVIEKTFDKFGQLDVLINNAGIIHLGNIAEGTMVQAFDNLIGTNLRAPIQLTTLAAPHLIKTKGNIVNISGIGGLYIPNVPQLLPHCVAKAGLNHFTLGSAKELSAHGVRVNAISPGPVYTNVLENSKLPVTWDYIKSLTALDKVSDPEEIADLVLFLASDKAKGITGSNYVTDNGAMLKR